MQYPSEPNRVWPVGLTEGESEARRRHLGQRARVFGFALALVLLFSYVCAPWMR